MTSVRIAFASVAASAARGFPSSPNRCPLRQNGRNKLGEAARPAGAPRRTASASPGCKLGKAAHCRRMRGKVAGRGVVPALGAQGRPRCHFFASPWTKIAGVGDLGGVSARLPHGLRSLQRLYLGVLGPAPSGVGGLPPQRPERSPTIAIFVHSGAISWHRTLRAARFRGIRRF